MKALPVTLVERKIYRLLTRAGQSPSPVPEGAVPHQATAERKAPLRGEGTTGTGKGLTPTQAEAV